MYVKTIIFVFCSNECKAI